MLFSLPRVSHTRVRWSFTKHPNTSYHGVTMLTTLPLYRPRTPHDPPCGLYTPERLLLQSTLKGRPIVPETQHRRAAEAER